MFQKSDKRSIIPLVNSGFVQHLDQGIWYISLFNDNPTNMFFRLKTEIHGKRIFFLLINLV